ncbi:MAG: hypothetical protein SVM80_11700 [Halobacteriota archaeon]|nr:hypothetical protein [Halobacteriota archaeon]
MCNLTEEIFCLVKEFEDDTRVNEDFRIKIKRSPGYIIGTTNIYPREGSEEELFLSIADRIKEHLIKHLKESGEIQVLKVSSGENIDLGIKQARILDGRFFEMYCYKCFSIVFLRIWLEEGIFIKKRWVSVDVDELISTPWFKDED